MKIAVDQIKNWIYVTGVPRSGTTFVGKILSLPREVDYVHEPFNPQCGFTASNIWYRYLRPQLDTEAMQQFHELTQSLFQYDFQLKTYISARENTLGRWVKQCVGSRGPFYLRLAKLNPFHTTALIKDPIGMFLTEYLYVQFGVKPVILIKHPLSQIASYRRVKLWPRLEHIGQQPALVEDYFADEQDFFNQPADELLEAASFWRAAYKVLLAQVNKYSDWLLITHESLCEQPIPAFQSLYQQLDLPWSDRIARNVQKKTEGNASAEAGKGKFHDFNRNSADIFKIRLNSLSLAERKQIFDIVEDVALQIYSRESFAIDG